MKWLLASTVIFLSVSTAFAGDTTFTTPEQAMKYCPSTDDLIFFYENGVTPDGRGAVVDRYGHFKNLYQSVGHPKITGEDNTIGGVLFREVNGIYGYVVNGVATCLYAYPTSYGVSYGLVMRGKK